MHCIIHFALSFNSICLPIIILSRVIYVFSIYNNISIIKDFEELNGYNLRQNESHRGSISLVVVRCFCKNDRNWTKSKYESKFRYIIYIYIYIQYVYIENNLGWRNSVFVSVQWIEIERCSINWLIKLHDRNKYYEWTYALMNVSLPNLAI